MRLNTTSMVISFAKKLEEDSAKLYENLAQSHPAKASILQSFARENRSNVATIERAYYEVISDAIEGCFAFDMDSDKYELSADVGASGSLGHAAAVEQMIVSYYTNAAQQAQSLMCDIPRAFKLVAKKRPERIAKLKLLTLG